MTEPSNAPPERRRTARILPKGTVIFLAAEHTQRGRIGNLSLGGLFATTEVETPERLLGRRAALELRLDGRDMQWLRLGGRITRIGLGGVAVEFDETPPAFVRMLDQTATASHAHHRVLSVVLVDASHARRTMIAEAFRSVGCAVIDVATSLEAIVRLGESKFEPEVIAIADSIPSATSAELRDFVTREHPNAKLVTIGDELVGPEGLSHWLSSLDPGLDLGARIRKVLTRPRGMS